MTTSVACPLSYETAIAGYTARYHGFKAYAQARCLFLITHPTVLDYDGYSFTLRSVAQVLAGLPGTQFQFYVNPTPAPALPIVGINLTGAADVDQIGTVIQAVLNANGFTCLNNGAQSRTFYVLQILPGSLGNTQVGYAGGDVGIFVNGFPLYNGSAYFYGGQNLGIPLLWGPQHGMGPTPANTFRGDDGGG